VRTARDHAPPRPLPRRHHRRVGRGDRARVHGIRRHGEPRRARRYEGTHHRRPRARLRAKDLRPG
jgi:hypothetical protein